MGVLSLLMIVMHHNGSDDNVWLKLKLIYFTKFESAEESSSIAYRVLYFIRLRKLQRFNFGKQIRFNFVTCHIA